MGFLYLICEQDEEHQLQLRRIVLCRIAALKEWRHFERKILRYNCVDPLHASKVNHKNAH